MLPIRKKYIIDEKQRKVAVQLDIATFNKIEKALEDHALGKYMEESDESEKLSLNEAKAYYTELTQAE